MEFQVGGEPAHTRCLSVALSQGAGRSIEFRADILDLRKGGLMRLAGRVAGAGIIHQMMLEGSLSADTWAIQRLDWDQPHVMHEANSATQGECCRDPLHRLEALVGTRIGADFATALKQCFGGPLGCTHISTLLQELVAVVARLRDAWDRTPEMRIDRAPGERILSRSLFIDALVPAGGATTELSVRLADLYFAALDVEGYEHVLSHDELRLRAEAELANWQLRGVEAGERSRRGPSSEDPAWQSRTDALRDFAGRSLAGGMARHCLERFGGRSEDALLLSALLSLGPAMTQIGLALTDAFAPSSGAPNLAGAPLGAGPCYMLREEGPLRATLSGGEDSSGR